MILSESFEAYQAREGARSSILKEILRSPLHALEAMKNPKAPTPAMELGTLVHSCILEPHLFEALIVSPKFDRRTKDGKAQAQEFEETHKGKMIVGTEDYDLVSRIVTNVYAHPAAKNELHGSCEQSVLWDEDGIVCKARPDLMREGVIIDVKTTQDASPSGFARQVATLKYHLQAAHYLKGVSINKGVQFEVFKIIAVETKPPYAVAVYELDFGTLEAGEALWAKAFELYRQCITLNEWPGYSENCEPLAIPAWAFAEAGETL